MKARFIILIVFSLFLFNFGNIPKSEAANVADVQPAVSIMKFDTTSRYNIHEYHGGVFHDHFNQLVENLKKGKKLIKVLTFITNVKGETTIEHKIYYSQNVVKDTPIHKVYLISSSPDEGEKYFLNLCFEYEYVNLLHFGFTPNGLRMYVFETNI